jgi:L-threonylcarbamoyladenylate synthase
MILHKYMKTVFHYTDNQLIKTLQAGGLAVLRTDTVYGIVARADLQQSVERIFTVKGRDSEKALIVLMPEITSIPPMKDTWRDIYAAYSQRQPTSIIIPATNEPRWLTRGQASVAYRVPQLPELQQLLRTVGSLVAPSANPQGKPPARTIDEAKDYFGEAIDIYVDGGEVPKNISPSRLIRPDGDTVTILR